MCRRFAPRGPVEDRVAGLRGGVGVGEAMAIEPPCARDVHCLWQGQMVPSLLLRVEGQ